MIKFLVKGQNIETLEHEMIAADQIAFVKIQVKNILIHLVSSIMVDS